MNEKLSEARATLASMRITVAIRDNRVQELDRDILHLQTLRQKAIDDAQRASELIPELTLRVQRLEIIETIEKAERYAPDPVERRIASAKRVGNQLEELRRLLADDGIDLDEVLKKS